jgi:hypothetical protein
MCADVKGQTKSREWGSVNWLGWFGAVVLVYFLSSGPVGRMAAKGHFGPGRPLGGAVKDVAVDLYYPITLAYHDTFLHKPIGLYLHLWAPTIVDATGNLRAQ